MMTWLTLLAMTMASASWVSGTRGGGDEGFVCPTDGRFPNEDDPTCQGYHLCTAHGPSFRRTNYNCPDGTVFDRDFLRCSSTAECRPQGAPTDGGSSDSSSDEYDGDEFVCRRAGLFDDVRDPFCSKYNECRRVGKGALVAIPRPCPPPSRFNPATSQCSFHYTCPRQFRCKYPGRFEDATDDADKRYFLCSKKRGGDFAQTLYTCPLYSRFDPVEGVCVVPDEEPSSEEPHDVNLPTENWEHLDKFVCRARGFFDNTGDPFNRTFYFCDVTADGKLFKYILLCFANYFFDASTKLCTQKTSSH